MDTDPAHLSVEHQYQPRFPTDYRPGIGIIGCGGIVKKAHLPAYQKYGLTIVGIYDPNPKATCDVAHQYGVRHIFSSVDELLSHPEIEVVDIATHTDLRPPLIHAALDAGKHVLSQKPFSLDMDSAIEIVEHAERRGLTVAVNQNGRWSPHWRVATLLIESGVIGDVIAVTHLFDRKFTWVSGSTFDGLKHCAINDYAIHWIDITRCWLANKRLETIRCRDYRIPNQPPDSQTPWGMWLEMAYADGTNAMIRAIGGVETERKGHPFWIHGTKGTIRGSVLNNDYVELETNGHFHRYDLEGHWFPDGFAGAMGELLSAIADGREPTNSARDNLLTLGLTLSASRSADEDGIPIGVREAAMRRQGAASDEGRSVPASRLSAFPPLRLRASPGVPKVVGVGHGPESEDR